MRKLLGTLTFLVALTLGASAQITLPYSFTAGTVISPDEVNTNFSTLANSACNVGGCTMTGVLKVVAGTVTAPGIGFAAETNTGIYRPAAGSIAMTLAGTQRLLLDATGLTVYGTNILNTSGKVPALTSTYFASVDGNALTNLNAANLAGTAAAINGSNITNLNATNLASGTVPDARFPATLPAASGVNLTALNATNLGSGTVPTARLGSGTADSTSFLRGDSTWVTVTEVLLCQGSGTNTSTSATNYATCAMSGLDQKDMIHVVLRAYSQTQGTSTPSVYNSTDSVQLFLPGVNVSANTDVLWEWTIACSPFSTTRTITTGYMTDASDALPSPLLKRATPSTAWTGSWTLALRHAGVTSGGTFYYSYGVYKKRGV